ncbi:MAG TPA: aminotransferase class III-fold pyridoxal phosphate-dependent enzyme, partial [Pyrodictium sp.]|nr:aminotransferase class III-fold pyridoxal phosphate-dependent enzyme [Pyrodictium sp.]
KLVLHGAGVSDVEVEAASKISMLMPFAERVVFTSSGSEAVMLAFRLARAYTGRDKIVKFDGNYHGWHDYSLYNVSIPASRGKVVETAGVPTSVQNTVDVLPYNNVEAFEKYMDEKCGEVAAVIMELVAHSMGVVPAKREFVNVVAKKARECGSLLIFDEIITAVRHNLRGLQTEFGVQADLTTIGKALGNGMPIAALVGRREILHLIAEDKVVASGTYQAHPLSLAASLAVLEKMERVGGDRLLARIGGEYCRVVEDHVEELKIRAHVSCFRSTLTIYFGLGTQPYMLEEVLKADMKQYRLFAQYMRRKGVLVNPHPRKRMHLSLAHADRAAIEFFSNAVYEALKKVKFETTTPTPL